MARVTDQQVRKLREEMAKHGCAELASMRSGMHRNTGRKYLNNEHFVGGGTRLMGWVGAAVPTVDMRC